MTRAPLHPSRSIASARLTAATLLAALLTGCGGGSASNPATSNVSGLAAETTMHSFAGPDGSAPLAGVVAVTQDNLYGTTAGGGAHGAGTVYAIDSNGALTVLHSFSGPDGYAPGTALVRGSDGNLYGTTSSGGAHGAGTLFRMSPSGALTVLHSFSGPDGFGPSALVQGSDGNFYGTTHAGGTTFASAASVTETGAGAVFRLSPSGALTLLYSFSGPDGFGPSTLVQGSDGNFYGTTDSGGPAFSSAGGSAQGAGTVFRISANGALTTLYAFSGTQMAQPTAIVQGSDGNLYGTTYSGGRSGNNADGMVFQLTPAGALTALYSFGGSDGMFATSLMLGSDGNFYGTTAEGGPAYTSSGGSVGYGTVFRITPAGALTTLYAFTGADGDLPQGTLVQDSAGNLYGTTASGGVGAGTVYQLTPR